MARRNLSMQGRVFAAALSVAVGGALVGVMAAGDHTADATSPGTSSGTSSVTVPSNDDGIRATPYGGDSSVSPQPQTRTGGS